jgi:hypothetical protein
MPRPLAQSRIFPGSVPFLAVLRAWAAPRPELAGALDVRSGKRPQLLGVLAAQVDPFHGIHYFKIQHTPPLSAGNDISRLILAEFHVADFLRGASKAIYSS